MIGAPTSRAVKEIEVDGNGHDGDLKKVEKAECVDGGGFVGGTRKEDHENRSRPDEEEDVRWFRSEQRPRHKGLIVGAETLGEGFKRESGKDEKPDLADKAGGKEGRPERAESGDGHDGEKQNVGSEKTCSGGAEKLEVKNQEEGNEKGGQKCETAKFASEEQTQPHFAERGVFRPSMRNEQSVHQKKSRNGGEILVYERV